MFVAINAIALVMTIFGFEETQQHQSERWYYPTLSKQWGCFLVM